MNHSMSKLAFTMLVSLFANATHGQGNFRVSPKDSRMLIHGTSTLHDWRCRADQMSGQMQAELVDGKLKRIRTLMISFGVTSIRSIKENGDYYERGMDRNVHRALHADRHSDITFTLSKVNSIKSSGKQWIVEASGILRVAGTGKEITLTVHATPANSGIIFDGKLPIQMTTFNVDPPTALFGTIKTGNEVQIEFKMSFQQIQ